VPLPLQTPGSAPEAVCIVWHKCKHTHTFLQLQNIIHKQDGLGATGCALNSKFNFEWIYSTSKLLKQFLYGIGTKDNDQFREYTVLSAMWTTGCMSDRLKEKLYICASPSAPQSQKQRHQKQNIINNFRKTSCYIMLILLRLGIQNCSTFDADISLDKIILWV